MVTCPACGKENAESAYECKRCRAPLREESPASGARAGDSLGEVCRRCEAYNEPGAKVCSNCGLAFMPDAGGEPPLDKTPEQPYQAPEEQAASDHTPPDGTPSVSDEMSALALSPEEAAEAGMSRNGQPPLDKTPEQPFKPPHEEEAPPPPPPAPAARAAAAAPGVSARKSEPAPPPQSITVPSPSGYGTSPPAPAKAPAPGPAAAEKVCSNCGLSNPPAAKFCFDCGTPFAKKETRRPPPRIEPLRPPEPEPPPSIQISAELIDDQSTSETSPVPLEEPVEEAPPAEEEAVDAASVAEPIEEETPPPFQASLIVEKGSTPGTAFALEHLENSLGSSGTRIELAEDAFIAPHAATVLFAEDHLVLRDEGSANGVFVKVRESAPLEPGDLFIAGERLFRYDGPTELDKDGEGETPFLGAPRPAGPATVRITEVLAGGKTGRTCHRSGPVIAIGKTGCDLNFPGDSLLAARHAEIRLGEDGSVMLADLGLAPAGVFLRVKGTMDLQAGDVLMVGEQQLRVEVG
jgi:ribosomal protein L40E